MEKDLQELLAAVSLQANNPQMRYIRSFFSCCFLRAFVVKCVLISNRKILASTENNSEISGIVFQPSCLCIARVIQNEICFFLNFYSIFRGDNA